MKFLPYEDVPLYISTNEGDGEYIFAESASLSVDQPLSVTRQVDDNLLQICEFGLGEDMEYQSPTFQSNTSYTVCLGPAKGPPKPLATSIYRIPSGTKVSFPNNKNLYFSDDISPEGDDFLVSLYPKSGGWTLSDGESQSGYFEPVFNYVSDGPVQGTLNVGFYPNTGNLKNFFNITGLSNPTQYPPIDEGKITGFLGDFAFTDAYLTSYSFSLSPNGISQASASFLVYGELKQNSSLSQDYYSSNLYQQQSVPHGETSQVIGHTSLGINHPISFSYNISVNRNPAFVCPTGSDHSQGRVPTRVTKEGTTIEMSIEGDSIDPNILSNGLNGKRANITAELRDLSYSNFSDNSNGFMNSFSCSGVIASQSLSVNSAGYLNGAVSVTQSLS
jgi:hypothetical protein